MSVKEKNIHLQTMRLRSRNRLVPIRRYHEKEPIRLEDRQEHQRRKEQAAAEAVEKSNLEELHPGEDRRRRRDEGDLLPDWRETSEDREPEVSWGVSPGSTSTDSRRRIHLRGRSWRKEKSRHRRNRDWGATSEAKSHGVSGNLPLEGWQVTSKSTEEGDSSEGAEWQEPPVLHQGNFQGNQEQYWHRGLQGPLLGGVCPSQAARGRQNSGQSVCLDSQTTRATGRRGC